jgi:hypothetical protein
MSEIDVQQTLLLLLKEVTGNSAGQASQAAGPVVESGTVAAPPSQRAAQPSQIAGQLDQLQGLVQGQAQAIQGIPQAVWQGMATESGGGVGSMFANVGKAIYKSGLGLSPLFSGLMKLFGGGGGQPEPPPLIKYRLPDPVHLSGGFSESSGGYVWPVHYGQGDRPRLAPVPEFAPGSGSQAAWPEPASAPAPAASTQQITIQVQAMDSRSFLDHSEEIARAVREAMLNSHALNDVVQEL